MLNTSKLFSRDPICSPGPSAQHEIFDSNAGSSQCLKRNNESMGVSHIVFHFDARIVEGTVGSVVLIRVFMS
jgi:hypothetical protein